MFVYFFCEFLGLVLISSLMILASIAMFTFPKNLKGNRIPPPMKMRAIEAAKKLEKQDEEAKPRLRGMYSLKLYILYWFF